MLTYVRTTKSVHDRSGRRRKLTALLAAVATVTAPLVVAGAPAQAGPVDTGWAATGPTAVTVSDGADAAASFTYDMNPSGVGTTRSWDFTVVADNEASPGDPIKVPWTWQGLHAWFNVTAQLQPIVNGVPVDLPETPTTTTFLVNAGPQSCCTTPSNGFLFGGVATFDNVPDGATYGFRLSGRNSDSNNFLRGTFTLSTRPYIDATIGTDNRQWVGATTLTTAGLDDGRILEAGEARWYKFPVVPGQKVTVALSNLSRDYDLALYSDIGAAFDRLINGDDLTQLAAASSAGAPGSGTQVAEFPDEVQDVPTSAGQLPSTQFAPRIYAPRIYAPRIYAPRIYAPRIYAPRIYAPRIYAPNSYVPDLASNDAFRDAFTGAQNQSLLVVSANAGSGADGAETVSASTGNTQGFFYVRVQGHDDQVFDPDQAYHLGLTVEGGEDCVDLSDFASTPTIGPAAADPSAVILTDTRELGLSDDPEVADDPYDAYTESLDALADSTGGVVVDVTESDRVRDLQQQVAEHPGCPYAVNLVADAIKDIVDSYRSAEGSNLAYVVIAGGDHVIPFFRYPDTSGLGQESQFDPPMLDDTPSGASLSQDQVLSQDAYGARTEVTIGGATVPVPDLAVGRLVKTPEEIESTIDHFVQLKATTGGTLPITGAGRSLVTGYDFLEDAAERVNDEFVTALPGGEHDTLIEESGTPHSESWTATDLRQALLGSRHDLVYLAGHFSANDTLAADFTTTFEADELGEEANAGKLTDTLVLSAGCHSGYSIVDGEAGLGVNTVDWSQRMAQQHAVLIGGTGYQYGDTDFLEYSERLYLGIAKRLREGPATGDAPPVAVGQALALAKQDYLATLSTLQGIDQKAVLQATLYGLPMTGFDAPGRAPLDSLASQAAPAQVTSGPGQTLGLWTDDLTVNTPTERDSKFVAEAVPVNGTGLLTWRNGRDGVTVQPGAPALPKQVVNVTADDLVLRGVGFRGGDYADSSGLLPLTGAPAVEGATPNTTFDAPAFFPQRLATANYFGALGESGRTSLILTPAQYRNDEGADALTNTERAYANLGVRLFYSGAASQEFGDNQPSLAAPPSIGAAKGVLGTDGKVTFSVRATGDPSAGVQQVWVTWTGGPDVDGNGRWRSVDLAQDPLDSTLWTGVLDTLPAGQDREKLRFFVQAANGVGAVGLDTAEGDGYTVGEAGDVDTANVELDAGAPGEGSPLGVSATVTDPSGAGLPGRRVLFTVLQGETTLFQYDATTDVDGQATLGLPDGQALPSGAFTVVAFIFDELDLVTDSDTLQVDSARMTVETGNDASPLGVVATVTDITGAPWEGRTVRWTVLRDEPDEPDELYTGSGLTDSDGIVPVAGDGDRLPAGPLTVRVKLIGLDGEVAQTETVDVFVDGLELVPDPAYLGTRAGTAFAAPLRVTVSDDFGAVKVSGLEVTFTLPETGPGATFPGGLTSITVDTDENGVATSPVPTARTTVGSFVATVSTAGAEDLLVPMAAQYGFGAFVSPVSSTTTTSSTGTTPVKIAALLANGEELSDAEAAALVLAGRVQVRWHDQGVTPLTWLTSTGYTVTYDAKKDFFQADLKASSLGWVKNHSYTVELRILPSAFPTVLEPALQSEYDLGGASFTIKVTK